MYSGLFTHHIKAVLPPPQIEQLFGLLGYRSSPSQQEQVLSVAPSSPDDFLRLSCAFFLARCECRLLEEALGKHRGEAQWELKMVRERQRGHGVQVGFCLHTNESSVEITGLQSPDQRPVPVHLGLGPGLGLD